MSNLRRAVAVLLLVVCGALAAPSDALPQTENERQLYRTLFLRAAPGELATVLEMLQERWPTWEAASAIGPFRMRHSQGDHWDLMLVFHVGDGFEDYFNASVVRRTAEAWTAAGETDDEFEARLLPHVAWREELWVWGPSAADVATRFADAGYFHVEVFLAIAGKREELLNQRAMENVYLDGIGRARNLIFERAGGAAWDSYTIGFYRDIKHFAESADIAIEVEDRAAVAAGFESSSTIGTYLRSLIARHHDTLATAVVLPADAALAQEAAGQWPQWRGLHRDGTAPDTGLLDAWAEDGPPLLFSMNGAGEGFSSIAVTAERILTMGDHGDEQFVLAFDRASGEPLWRTAIGPAWVDEYGGPRATPTVVDGVAYALATEGALAALDVATGDVLWQIHLQSDLGGSMPEPAADYPSWRYAESPLVDGDRLIVTPGGPESLIVALDRHTGETIWRTVVPEFGETGVPGAGYSSAVISEAGGIRQYVQLIGYGLVGVEATTGRLLWTYGRVANSVANIPTPVVDGDYVLTATGYGAGSALLQLVPDGDGIRADEVWFNEAGTMQNHHGGMVLHEGTIYLGQGHNRGYPQAVDFLSGEVVWGPERNDGTGSGAVMYADGHLYYRYQNGVMVLVEATRDGYVEKGSFTIPDHAQFSWAHLVIVDGLLYVREQDAIHVYDVRVD